MRSRRTRGEPEPQHERVGGDAAATGRLVEALRGARVHLEEDARAWIADLTAASTTLRRGIGARKNKSLTEALERLRRLAAALRHAHEQILEHVGRRTAVLTSAAMAQLRRIDQLEMAERKLASTNEQLRKELTDRERIARGMGKKTVAEFVADEETTDLLRTIGVDCAQGPSHRHAETDIGANAGRGVGPGMTSPATGPPLAYRDDDFLDSDEGRPLRILSEYLQPLRSFRQHRVHDTIVFFGSARLREDGPMGSCYTEARELARLLTEWSNQLRSSARRFLICTGGGGGIMEAANRGAVDAGGRTIGLNIGLPHEQRPNPYITRGLCFEFHYFFMRKLWFAHLARAIVAFPGGFGTLDELFEILTLSQTRKLARPVIVLLYGSSYWNEIVNFPALVKHGMVSAEDLALFRVVNSPAEALDVLKRGLVTETAPATPAIAKSVTRSGAS